ncbi:MAG TPA: YggT family protein [Calditerricola sp.]
MADVIHQIVDIAFEVYMFLIFAYVLMSWLPQLRETPLGQLLGRLVEPYLRPFRQIIPPIGMFDLSPIVAVFALYFARIGVHTVLNLLLGDAV